MSASATARETAIRPLDRSDRVALASLIDSVELFSGAEKDVALEVLDSYLENPGKDYFALGAFTQRGSLLGYACYGPTPCTSGTWDLYWIAVSGGARGRGIGSLLMEEIERRLVQQRARLVLIETSSRTDYEPTRGFYERRGYEVIARVPDFYAVGDDRVIFARNFESEQDER
jgi:ribosomal protein S18 acetylase RimI-like enzyme